MSKEMLRAAADAMLADDATPETIREIGEMVEEGDLPDTPDDDQGPVNPEAAKRVTAWLERTVLEKLAATWSAKRSE
jgi:hypothetical protein